MRHTEVRCACGLTVDCYEFTNECDRCGQLYNWAGQRLAPPHPWGEETGERFDSWDHPIADYPGEERDD